MPGTRTAPSVEGTATNVTLSLHWYDGSDFFTDSILLDTGSTATEQEAYAAALQAMSNASLWKVSISTAFEGIRSPSNALQETHQSVQDKIRIFYKNPTTKATQDVFVPSPLEALIGDEDDIVDIAAASFIAAATAIAGVLPAGYNAETVRFVEHSETNAAVRP